MAREKMKCPVCGAEMNYHANKVVYASPKDHGFDSALGGVVEEGHSCPACGKNASRLHAL